MMVRVLWWAVPGCAMLAAALVVTWPLALSARTAIPLGTEQEATVPLFNLWTLWWTADRAAHGFARYWDAPFFYPNRGVFAYSEPQILTGLVVSPLWGAGAAPALVYNSVLWASLTLNGLFAYRVSRALDLSRAAALCGGVLMVALPFVANVLGVLPLVALFGMAWTLDGLVRFGRSGAGRAAIWAGAGLVATFLSCQQYALLFAPFAAAAAVVALAEQRFRPRRVACLSMAGLASAILMLLVAAPVARVHADLASRRPEWVVRALSARPGDFVTRPATAWLGVPPRDRADTAGLFPGAILSGLAATGAAIGLRDPNRRRWTLFLAVSAAAALLLAMGLHVRLGGWRPFASLRLILPGLDRLRSPFRFAVIMQLSLPMLAAVALARARASVPHGAAGSIVVALGLLGAIENLSVPAPLTGVPVTPRTAWTAWLRARAERTVVAHIPFPGGLHVSDYEIEARRLFAQIDHRKPLVNGYSGYFPQARGPDGSAIPTYTRFQLSMARQFPSERLFCVLGKRLGVTTLVIDQGWLRADGRRLERFAAFVRPAYRDAQVQIYTLRVPDAACDAETGAERGAASRRPRAPDHADPSGA